MPVPETPPRHPEHCHSFRRSAATSDSAGSAVLCDALGLLPSEATVGFPPPDRSPLGRRRLRSGSESGTRGPLRPEPSGGAPAEALPGLLATAAASLRVADPILAGAQTDPEPGPDPDNRRYPPIAATGPGPAPVRTTVSPPAKVASRVGASHCPLSERPGDEVMSALRLRNRRSQRLRAAAPRAQRDCLPDGPDSRGWGAERRVQGCRQSRRQPRQARVAARRGEPQWRSDPLRTSSVATPDVFGPRCSGAVTQAVRAAQVRRAETRLILRRGRGW